MFLIIDILGRAFAVVAIVLLVPAIAENIKETFKEDEE